jgi:hypothetical protein
MVCFVLENQCRVTLDAASLNQLDCFLINSQSYLIARTNSLIAFKCCRFPSTPVYIPARKCLNAEILHAFPSSCPSVRVGPGISVYRSVQSWLHHLRLGLCLPRVAVVLINVAKTMCQCMHMSIYGHDIETYVASQG